MSTEVIQIVINENGSRTVKRNIDDIGDSADKSGRKVDSLKNVLGSLKGILAGVAGALFLNQLRQYSDEWTQINNRIRLNTTSTAQATAVQEELFQAAQRTRTEFKTLVQLYARSAQAGKSLNASQRELIDFSEGVGMALAVQGVSATDASGALLQLGQALGMGKLRAQEFNSINEQAPRILQAAANHIDKAGGSVSRLKKLLEDGKVTNKEFFQAFLKDIPKLREEFEKANPTIGQAFTVLNNALGKFVGESDQAAGISTTLARGLINLSTNLPTIAKWLGVIAVGMIAAFGNTIAAYIGKAVAAIRTFTVALASNPLGLFAVALSTVIAALAIFRDQITVIAEGHVTLGDYMRAAWSYMSEALTYIVDLIRNYVIPAVTSMWTWLTEGSGTVTKALRFMFQEVGGVIKTVLNGIIRPIAFLVQTSLLLFNGLADAVKDLFVTAFNFVVSTVENNINTVLKGVNFLLDLVGKGPISDVAFGRMENPAAGAALKLGTAVKDAFLEGLDTDYIGKALGATIDFGKRALDALTARAKGFAAERQKPTAQGNPELNKRMTAPKMVPQELIDLNKELDHRIKLMGMMRDAREVEHQMWQITHKLEKEGVTLSAKESEGIRQKLTLIQTLTQADEAYYRLWDEYRGSQKELLLGQAALNKLLADGAISATQYRIKLAELKIAAGQGTFADGFITGLESLRIKAEQVASKIGEVFAGITNTLIDGLADATARALVFGESFSDAIGNMARQALATLISGLIKLGLQMALNWALSQTFATAATGASVAMAATTAAAWAPAAAFASLATLGTNSAPATAALTGTVALSKGLAIVGGFKEGGYTGNLGKDQIAGVTHGQEFVVNAEGTRKNRAVLEAMNRGYSASRGSGSSRGGVPVEMNIYVEHDGSTAVDVQRLSETEVRVIARQEADRAVREKAPSVVAADLTSSPNSRMSKAMTSATSVQRRRA